MYNIICVVLKYSMNIYIIIHNKNHKINNIFI